jgi:hypothetical protein
VLLLVGAAAFGPLGQATAAAGSRMARALAWVRVAAGLVLVLLLGRGFLAAAEPVLQHVEYAGLIPRLEQIAATVGEDDLLVVESRGASDAHVLALPLAYIYARHVLVLWEPAPDKALFREFLSWARERYARVLFLGGGGTELLSRSMAVHAIGGERFQVPEYQSVWNTYPRRTTFKEFDFGIYELRSGQVATDGFDLDVGVADDVYVRRFHAKERRPNGATFRWTRDISFVSIVGLGPACRRLTLRMGHGGRPSGAPAADVAVFLNDLPIGLVRPSEAFEAFTIDVPPDLAAAAADAEAAAQLRIVTQTWNPRRVLDLGDDRDLGVMLERLTVECPGPDAQGGAELSDRGP